MQLGFIGQINRSLYSFSPIKSLPYLDESKDADGYWSEYVKTKISDAKEKKFVVLCHAGIRSYNFGQWSLDNNLINEIWNLEEGIDGWSKYIDQTIPRY